MLCATIYALHFCLEAYPCLMDIYHSYSHFSYGCWLQIRFHLNMSLLSWLFDHLGPINFLPSKIHFFCNITCVAFAKFIAKLDQNQPGEYATSPLINHFGFGNTQSYSILVGRTNNLSYHSPLKHLFGKYRWHLFLIVLLWSSLNI